MQSQYQQTLWYYRDEIIVFIIPWQDDECKNLPIMYNLTLYYRAIAHFSYNINYNILSPPPL